MNGYVIQIKIIKMNLSLIAIYKIVIMWYLLYITQNYICWQNDAKMFPLFALTGWHVISLEISHIQLNNHHLTKFSSVGFKTWNRGFQNNVLYIFLSNMPEKNTAGYETRKLYLLTMWQWTRHLYVYNKMQIELNHDSSTKLVQNYFSRTAVQKAILFADIYFHSVAYLLSYRTVPARPITPAVRLICGLICLM